MDLLFFSLYIGILSNSNWDFSLQHIHFSSCLGTRPLQSSNPPSQAWPVAPPARTWDWWKMTSPVWDERECPHERKWGGRQEYRLQSIFNFGSSKNDAKINALNHQLSRCQNKPIILAVFLPKETGQTRSKAWKKITRPHFSNKIRWQAGPKSILSQRAAPNPFMEIRCHLNLIHKRWDSPLKPSTPTDFIPAEKEKANSHLYCHSVRDEGFQGCHCLSTNSPVLKSNLT